MIKKELLEILACPKCKGSIEHMKNLLRCKDCKQSYPIVDGIPILILEKAKDILNRQVVTESLDISVLKSKTDPVGSDLVDRTEPEDEDSIKVLITKSSETV